jgi:hypothetical protein
MLPQITIPKRFIGLDIHKHYRVAIGVDEDLNQVLGPQRVELLNLEKWLSKTLCKDDAVVIEMTTNTWQIYDDLLPHVGSVTVVHPPHVALITRSQVMNDKIAASILARLPRTARMDSARVTRFGSAWENHSASLRNRQAQTRSSAYRLINASPRHRGVTTFSTHRSKASCQDTWASTGETTPPWGVPVSG